MTKIREEIENVIVEASKGMEEFSCLCPACSKVRKKIVVRLGKLFRSWALEEKCPRCGKRWIIHDCPEDTGRIEEVGK